MTPDTATAAIEACATADTLSVREDADSQIEEPDWLNHDGSPRPQFLAHGRSQPQPEHNPRLLPVLLLALVVVGGAVLWAIQ